MPKVEITKEKILIDGFEVKGVVAFQYEESGTKGTLAPRPGRLILEIGEIDISSETEANVLLLSKLESEERQLLVEACNRCYKANRQVRESFPKIGYGNDLVKDVDCWKKLRDDAWVATIESQKLIEEIAGKYGIAFDNSAKGGCWK